MHGNHDCGIGMQLHGRSGKDTLGPGRHLVTALSLQGHWHVVVFTRDTYQEAIRRVAGCQNNHEIIDLTTAFGIKEEILRILQQEEEITSGQQPHPPPRNASPHQDPVSTPSPPSPNPWYRDTNRDQH